MNYTPPPEILERYARLLVHFGLGNGEGIKRGDVVRVYGSDACKPLYVQACQAVWRAGGHVIHWYRPSTDDFGDVTRAFYELADDEQLDFVPESYLRGAIEQVDHDLVIFAQADPRALAGVDAAKQMRHAQSLRPMQDLEQVKENRGEFSWTVASYGTPGMAAEAGLAIEEYWEQIINACFLDLEDPVVRWLEVRGQIRQHRDRLNALPIDRLHIEGPDADLWLTLGQQRIWRDGLGCNIPSFEIFTSPDWRGTEGWIRFSEPLYTFGSLIRGVELEFKDGRVVRATANESESLLQEMIATENADRIGEFSLTDGRLSRINRFMADTLYDENMGGPYGNTHLALGNAYQDTFDGDAATLDDADWERLGFNRSVIHTDIVSTTDRTVTAIMKDGSEQIIYADGRFQADA
jgi:aminopeptidase